MSSNYTAALLYTVAIVAVFYFMWWRPQQTQRKAMADMLAELMPGDRVITAGGLYGTVREIEEDAVALEIAPGVVARFAKGAIVSRIPIEPGPLDE